MELEKTYARLSSQPSCFRCAWALAAIMMLAGTVLLPLRPAWAQPLVLIGDGQMDGFENKASDKIDNHTSYSWVRDEDGPGGLVLEAVAETSASGLVREEELPFSEQAVIEVTYKVVAGNNPADEKSKQGDDFPLRIYVTSKNLVFYKTLVLVHSLQNDKGSSWLNPFSNQIAKFMMYAFAGKQEEVGQWHTRTIAVGRLWQETYGDVPDSLDAISLMVDSDNSGGRMQTRISKLVYRD